MRPGAAAGAPEARGRACHCPADGPRGPPPPRGPERLYLPISKRQEYLQSSGEKVLASFPVQATIHFYDDDSDSEDGEHDGESQRLPPEVEGPGDCGPGGTGRDPLTLPGRRYGGHGGQGRLPHGDSPGGAQSSSFK